MRSIINFFKNDQHLDVVSVEHLSIAVDTYFAIGVGVSKHGINIRLGFVFIRIMFGGNI